MFGGGLPLLPGLLGLAGHGRGCQARGRVARCGDPLSLDGLDRAFLFSAGLNIAAYGVLGGFPPISRFWGGMVY